MAYRNAAERRFYRDLSPAAERRMAGGMRAGFGLLRLGRGLVLGSLVEGNMALDGCVNPDANRGAY